MLYSKSTGGFYAAETHGDNMPADVTHESEWEYTHAELLEGQSQGKLIAFDEAGHPLLVDPPTPTAEQLQAQINTEARTYLASTDWYVIRWQENGTPIPEDIATTRTEARANVIEV